MNVTVLAATYQEGRRFLASLGIRGNVVFDLRSATGRRFDVILELPSWERHRGKHGVEGMLRGQRQPGMRMLIDEDDLPKRAVVRQDPDYAHQITIDEAIAETPLPPKPQPKKRAAKKTAAKKAAPKKADPVDDFYEAV